MNVATWLGFDDEIKKIAADLTAAGRDQIKSKTKKSSPSQAVAGAGKLLGGHAKKLGLGAGIAAGGYALGRMDKKSSIFGKPLAVRMAEKSMGTTKLLPGKEKKSYIDPISQGVGGYLGYRYGKMQKARGEKHTFGAKQVGSLLIPGGAGYQVGRALAHSADPQPKSKVKKSGASGAAIGAMMGSQLKHFV